MITITGFASSLVFLLLTEHLEKSLCIGIYNSENRLVAAAIVTLPEDIPQPEELDKKTRDSMDRAWLRRANAL